MNAGRTVFAQLIAFLSHNEFQKCVARYAGDRHHRSLSCWDQYLAMAFAQLTYRESLRDIEACLRSLGGKLYHMGFRSKVPRSTLADANETHDWRIFADFAQHLIGIARPLHAQDPIGLELDHTLYALDSTTIDLCLSLFPWAKFRQQKAAVKMHTLLDLRGSIPTFIRITDGKVHDVNILDEIFPEAGAFYVMDRGYIDFERLYVFTLSAAFFVVRTKENVLLERRYSHPVDKSTGVRSDQTVILTAIESAKAYPETLRRVSFYDAENDKRLKFLTNNFVLPALTIAKIYKSRWQVELFFENSTWCTPSYVYGISRASCFESAVAGVAVRFRSAIHRSTSALRMTQGAPAQACVAGNCFNRISRKTVVCVTPRTLPASPTNISLRACRSPSR
jgi:hypothetical protein